MNTDRQQFRKVSIGLGMILASVVVLFFYVCCLLLTPLLGNIGIPALTSVVLSISVRFAVPVLITSAALGIIGPCLCLAAPREVRGTHYILITIGLYGMYLAGAAIGSMVAFPKWLTTIAGLLMYLAAPFLILFVRQVGAYLQRDDVVKLARSALRLAAIAAVVLAIEWGLVFVPGLPLPALFLLPILVFIFTILAFLRFLRMLVYARRATLEYSQGGGPGGQPDGESGQS